MKGMKGLNSIAPLDNSFVLVLNVLDLMKVFTVSKHLIAIMDCIVILKQILALRLKEMEGIYNSGIDIFIRECYKKEECENRSRCLYDNMQDSNGKC
jgi:hypothetical protein